MSESIDTKPETKTLETTAFDELVGEDIIAFLFAHAPTKVISRVARALTHYNRASDLIGLDEETGAVRLIAAEEELVVAIFEWLKLNDDKFPEHRDFVRKFKNHVVKLSVYPVIAQFRFILGDMLKNFSPGGLEFISWSAKPVIDGTSIKLSIYGAKGEEIFRHTPLAVMISQDETYGDDVIPSLLADLEENIRDSRNLTLKQFLLERADYRNKLLYATDAWGQIVMDDSLEELIGMFKQTYHDLLWVLVILIGAEMPSKEWGLVSQFIGLYREVLIKAGVLRADNTVSEIPSDLA
ncbi:hypothetical protein ABIB85_005150 [Bradyrhizobium sp. JR1.5]|uniref:hypothetical protein n=1 Tax=unclassified Bradyrhizobium TaxID=2631580 RepID=UPI003395CE13